MRLTIPASYRQLGPVCIMQQIDVLELESWSRAPTVIPTRPISAAAPASSEILLRNQGLRDNRNPGDTPSTVCFSNQTLEALFGQMVIIVPCKNEDPKTVRNVLRGIPASCAVLLVSNCTDGYTELSAMLEDICKYGRQAVLVHQKYQGAALAFSAVGVPQLLDPLRTGTIRDGKGEGMYLGLAMARTFFPERKYVGFVDADNQVPGSVNEYCRVYAAGFLLSHQYRDAGEEQVMVRISWQCKPKVKNGQISYDEPEGRSSRVVNSWLNRLFAKPFGDDSKFITTGNAGEHAMTMDTALSSRWANGYAIETHQFLDPFLPPTSNSRATTNGSRCQSRNRLSVASDNDGTGSDSDTDSSGGSVDSDSSDISDISDISIDSAGSGVSTGSDGSSGSIGSDSSDVSIDSAGSGSSIDSDNSGVSIGSVSSFGDADIEDSTFEAAKIAIRIDLNDPPLGDCATLGTTESVSYTREAVGVTEEEALVNGPAEAAGHNTRLRDSGKPRRILQIRTLNPHLHRQGDDLHILRMWAAGLGAIWHNLSQGAVIPGIDQSTLDEIRTEMVKYAVENGGLAEKKRLPRPRVYPALNQIDFGEFKKVMIEQRYLQSYGAPLFFGFDDCEQLDN